jgi:hypothetical protein
MDEKIIKTEFRIKKEARELSIYNEWNELMAQPGAMASAVDRYLRIKHGFGADSTIWFTRKRVEKRLRAEGKL